MITKQIPETLILSDTLLRKVIFEQCQPIFHSSEELQHAWQHENDQSYQRIYSFFIEELYPGKPITLRMIREALQQYRDTIIAVGDGSYYQLYEEHSEGQVEVNETVSDDDYIYTSSSSQYHLLRDMVTKNKNYEKMENGTYRSPIQDRQGNVHGLVEFKPSELMQQESYSEKQALWYELIGSAINSLDELTADLFDLITYQWIVSPKTEDGYITFHSDDALALKKQVTNEPFRNRDRFSIMQRIGALTSLWVLTGTESIQIYDETSLKEEKLDIENLHKMFDIGKVSIARDSATQKVLGIYELEIKPSKILLPFLDGRKGTLGYLDKQIFKYNHHAQREMKRLMRYLSFQWKIQTINRNYQSFKVNTLLGEMQISPRYKGRNLKERFEEILNALQADNVFDYWEYASSFDEPSKGEKKWYVSFWRNLNINIVPLDTVKKRNQKKIVYQQTSLFLDDDTKNSLTVELTPSTLEQTIKQRGLTIKAAATEIGVSYVTLRRYLKGTSQKMTGVNQKKVNIWVKR
ncbi:hypothetical protein [Sutcliffiella rhizosphaerae]|uniref:HTH cro/C1-type domain-containing protein n=1 Tax=Sutcliffiella rhizosphaerae TaxID=2880967 RepID=A0ABM8YSF7_9BACI|nr:hypothetical protein [Sutcliffiella rhizosphaerae]CAG9622782.1 hypothetical protein BACCIP111883_03573 [Sutcliffiella rhizosphaerae]